MNAEDVIAEYGEVPLIYSHYHNNVCIFKSGILEDNHEIYLQVSGDADVIDVASVRLLKKMRPDDFAYIKSSDDNQVVWKQGTPKK